MITMDDKTYNKIEEDHSSKLELKKEFSSSSIKVFRISVSIILVIYWIIMVIHFKMRIFETISKFLTLWGLVFASVYFIKSIFTIEEKLIINSHFLHLTITLEIVIFLGYWLIILPTGSISNNTTFKILTNLFCHLVIQIFLFIDIFLNKHFFINNKKNLFLHLSVFILYFIVNLIFVKVFDIVPYKAIKWDSYLDFILVCVMFFFVLVVWHFVLWLQRFKINIKEEHKNDKELKKHFFSFK